MQTRSVVLELHWIEFEMICQYSAAALTSTYNLDTRGHGTPSTTSLCTKAAAQREQIRHTILIRDCNSLSIGMFYSLI
jgi:hypothetical protein